MSRQNMDLRVIYILPFIFIRLILLSNKEWFYKDKGVLATTRHE